jgi:hypothetical protein
MNREENQCTGNVEPGEMRRKEEGRGKLDVEK